MVNQTKHSSMAYRYTDLIPTLSVHINRGEETGLGGVGVYPTKGVQSPLVLHVKDFLFAECLHRV